MSKRILIVDEDIDSARELQGALELHHYDVDRVETGEEALSSLEAGNYDLAVIDIELPRMSGLGVCEKLRHKPLKHPCQLILTSAFFRGAEEIRTIKSDTAARAFLPKPLELPQLMELIREALSQPAHPEGADIIRGHLHDTAFPKLLRRLSIIGATGLLQVESDKVKKIIYIDRGYPIFARSNLVRECLGQMLLREGALTQEAFEESLRKQKESKRLQGTILIEMGLLTPQELHDALSRQIEEKLIDIFSWKSGEYIFTPGRKFKEGTTAIKQSPAALILSGLTRYWTRPQTQDFLLPYQRQYMRQVDNPLYRFQEIGLDRRGSDLLRQCRGEHSLQQILKKNPLSAAESEKVMAALLLSGMVEARPVATPMDMDEPGLDGQKPSSAKLREQLIEDYSRMMQLDFFEILAVSRDCTTEAIRKSYYQLAKHYHPDQLIGQGLSVDVHDKVKELFQRISKAYETLSNEEYRKAYLQDLALGTKAGVDVNKVLQAEVAFQKGLVLLKASEFREAAQLLEQAAKWSPEEPEYLTYCAWAQVKAFPDSVDIRNNAIKMLNYSRQLNPRLDRTYLYTGYVYKQMNDMEKAQRQFEMALQSNPNCTEALRELRLHEMRTKKEGTGLVSGVLNRLFNK